MNLSAIMARRGQSELARTLDKVIGEDEQNLAAALDPDEK